MNSIVRRIVLHGEGIDFQALPPHLGGGVRLAVDEESTQADPGHIAGGLGDEVSLAVDDLCLAADGTFEVALVVGRQDQILAALAPVRAGGTHVDHEAEEGVVHRSRAGTRRDLDHRRAILLEVENGDSVDGAGVAGEKQRLAVHQLVEVEDLVRFRLPERRRAEPECFDRGGGDPVQEGLLGP